METLFETSFCLFDTIITFIILLNKGANLHLHERFSKISYTNFPHQGGITESGQISFLALDTTTKPSLTTVMNTTEGKNYLLQHYQSLLYICTVLKAKQFIKIYC